LSSREEAWVIRFFDGVSDLGVEWDAELAHYVIKKTMDMFQSGCILVGVECDNSSLIFGASFVIGLEDDITSFEELNGKRLTLVVGKGLQNTRDKTGSTTLEFLSLGIGDFDSLFDFFRLIKESTDFVQRAQDEVQAFTIASLGNFVSDHISELVQSQLFTGGGGFW